MSKKKNFTIATKFPEYIFTKTPFPYGKTATLPRFAMLRKAEQKWAAPQSNQPEK